MFYRAFIGPSLGGAFDEHFGFQWAMTVCRYSVIPRHLDSSGHFFETAIHLT